MQRLALGVVLQVVMVVAVVLSAVVSASSQQCSLVEELKAAGGHIHEMINVADGELVHVPFAAMITIDDAYRSPIGRVLMALELPDAQALALYLLFARAWPRVDPQLTSIKACHLAWLPTPDEIHVPILWRASEREALHPSQIASQVDDDARRARDAYKRWSADLILALRRLGLKKPDPAEVFSLSAFKWGLAVVSSRVFSVTVTDPSSGEQIHHRALVPVLDLANTDVHSRVRTIEAVGPDGSISLQSTAPIEAGAPVTVFYGSNQLSNVDLFVKYGFMLGGTEVHDPESDLPPGITVSLADGPAPLLVKLPPGNPESKLYINPELVAAIKPNELEAEIRSRIAALDLAKQSLVKIEPPYPPRTTLALAVLTNERWYASRALHSLVLIRQAAASEAAAAGITLDADKTDL
ncbi:uncharacterized protein AMSG_01901 [Thecamonas trahens ATCC 50062]|uniref:SET domain-containing protein n=1 Tax=Thecamonas trahens ATCC 50062 TaxID=461836 RepID=A0A0L0DTV6_THETB|nr:hypothetical protein AMSG_01901 [Thecamonas trahens ATCC 50062]KNC55632.1 hypothetical protein AMSG_01901 [Thecamonas trahens ATCC 50062]|eukprot:XP_013761402.1 hypothetical protein AMSG_01901 [Thecamonas trahens ATCC 50062]